MTEQSPIYHFEPLPIDPVAPANEQHEGILAQLGLDDGTTDDLTIKVYKLDANNALDWLFDLRQDDDRPLMDRLRDDYEGGTFEIRVYKDKKIFKRHKVRIKAPRTRRQPEAVSIPDVMKMIRDQQQQTIAQVERIVENIKAQQPAVAPIDPAQMRRELLAELAAYKELFTPPPQPKQQDQFALFRDFLEFQRELGIGQGGDDSMTGLISSVARDVIGPLARVAQAQQGNGAGRPRPQLAHTPAQPKPPEQQQAKPPQPPVNQQQPTPPQSTQPTQPTEQPPMMNELETGLAQLCTFAMLGIKPAGAAQSLHDNASDEQYQMLGDIIEAPDCIERLIQVYAPVANHREWFEQLRMTLQELYDLDAEGDDQNADELTDTPEAAITSENGDAAASHKANNAAHNEVAAHGDPGEDTGR